MEEIKEENRGELIDILDSYFDPEKEAIVPPAKPSTRRRSFKKGSPKGNRRSRNGNGKSDKKHHSENNNNELPATPDTPTHSPRRRRYRKRSSAKQLNKSLTETSAPSATEMMGKTSVAVNQSVPEIAVA